MINFSLFLFSLIAEPPLLLSTPKPYVNTALLPPNCWELYGRLPPSARLGKAGPSLQPRNKLHQNLQFLSLRFWSLTVLLWKNNYSLKSSQTIFDNEEPSDVLIFFFNGEQGHFICHFTIQANTNIRCFSVLILSHSGQWELLFLLWNVCWNMVLMDLKKYYAIWYNRSQVLKESNEHHKLHEHGVAENSN